MMRPANGDDDRLSPQPQPDAQTDRTTGSNPNGEPRPGGDEGAGVFQRHNAGDIAGETYQQVGAATGEFPAEQLVARREREAASTGKYAFLVGAGILLSRVVGLIRQRVFAYYFGTSAVKGA
ncbi:MAG: hypothetical protein QOF61_2504, partial [Acidobacteriota bacterium]|nr:hypothetical protein [Acidobacteriota bacterium]